MEITNLTAELMVDDMIKSINFYKDILGFDIAVSVPEKEPFFVSMNTGPVNLMLYQRDAFSEEIPKFKKMAVGGSIALYMDVNNIKTIFDEIKEKVNIIQPLHATNYGTTEFSFEDCNGYVLMLSGKE